MISPLIFITIAVLMLAIGYMAGRNQDEEGYNMYNRSLPKFGFLVSYAATYVGAGFFIVGGAYAYEFGFGMLWMVFGTIFGAIIFGFYSKWIREKIKGLNIYTMPEYFRREFGDKSAFILTLIILFIAVFEIAIQLTGGGKLLESIGAMSYLSSVVLTTVVVCIYLILSGFRAVVWTDYVLLSAMIIITIIIAGYSVEFFVPAEQVKMLSLPAVTAFGFFVYGVFSPFAVSSCYQRIFASKCEKTAKIGTWLSTIPILVIGIAIFITGMSAKILFPDIDPDTAFIRMISYGGSTLSIIGAVALWSALMSTVDTATFSSSQILNRDLFNKPLNKTNVGIGILIFLAFGFFISVFYPSIVNISLIFLSTILVISPSVFLHWFIKNLSDSAVSCSLIAGILSISIVSIIKGPSSDLLAIGFSISFVVLLVVYLFQKWMKKVN